MKKTLLLIIILFMLCAPLRVEAKKLVNIL